MTINRGCSHVRASHVVTCVMSRLAYDNSMALPPWKKRKLGRVRVATVPLCRRKPAVRAKQYILARFTGYTCTWCV